MGIEFMTVVEDVPDIDAIGQPVFAGLSAPSSATVFDREHCGHRNFNASPGETIVVAGYDRPFRVLVGLGDQTKYTAETIRKAAGAFAREVGGCACVLFDLRGVACASITAGDSAKAVAEGIALASHRFGGYKSDTKPPSLEHVAVLVDPDDVHASSTGLVQGAIIAEAVKLACDLANEPASVMTPKHLAGLSWLAESRT